MFPSENFSSQELTPTLVRTIEVGGSALPSVFVAKSSCGGYAGGGIDDRAGAVLAAGTVGAAVEGASAAMAARVKRQNCC